MIRQIASIRLIVFLSLALLVGLYADVAFAQEVSAADVQLRGGEIGQTQTLSTLSADTSATSSTVRPTVYSGNRAYTYDGSPHSPYVRSPTGSIRYRKIEKPYVYDSNLILELKKLQQNPELSNSTTTAPTITDVGTLQVYYYVLPQSVPTDDDAQSVLQYMAAHNNSKTAANHPDWADESYPTVVIGSASVTIVPKSISSCAVSVSPSSYVYDGKQKKPTVTVKNGSKTLVKGTDYKLSYKDNVNAGTATVIVTGKGNYTGKKSATFKISRAKITSAGVSLSKSSYVYTGKAVKPAPKVKRGGKTLSKGVDYALSYFKSPKEPGTYKVTVKGKGNYAGSVPKSYKVVPKGTSVKSLKARSDDDRIGFAVKWAKQEKAVTGYQVRYSTLPSFKGAKKPKTYKLSTAVGKACAASLGVPASCKGMRVYVQVRTYKVVKGKTCASAWSKAKSVVIK